MTEKPCRKCGETKPLSEFHRATQAADGHHTWCKTCRTAYQRNFREAHRDEIRSADRARYRDKHGWTKFPSAGRTHKRCSRCQQVLPIEVFRWHRGWYSCCRPCENALKRERYRAAHPLPVAEDTQTRRAKVFARILENVRRAS